LGRRDDGLGASTPTMCDKVGAGLNAFAHPGGYGLPSACNTAKPCGKVDLVGRRQRILDAEIRLHFRNRDCWRLLGQAFPDFLNQVTIEPFRRACLTAAEFARLAGLPANLLLVRYLQDCWLAGVPKSAMAAPARSSVGSQRHELRGLLARAGVNVKSQSVLTPAARRDSPRGFALAQSRVERHIQCQSLLAGCSFGPLELAGDRGGGCLLPRERLEFADVLCAPHSPSRPFDHLALLEFTPFLPPIPLAGRGEVGEASIVPTATVTCRLSQAAFASRLVPFKACK
jgi:hypothetical protein